MGAHSNGCVTCKTRRVKCDEGHPHCQRCQKAGISCKGYVQRRWIDEKPRVEHALATASTQEKAHSAIKKASCPNSIYHSGRLEKFQGYIYPQAIPAEISFQGFKNPMLISFLVGKLSEGGVHHSRHYSHIEGRNWIKESYSKSSGASFSLNALASIIFGEAHHLPSIIEEGRCFYASAISDLRLSLLDSSKNKSFETLASITALCMYELIDRRSEAAWNHHADGLSAFIKMRNPSQFQQYPEKGAFIEQRAILVMKAIFAGHDTFLSQPSWKTVPWANDPSSKGPTDYLIDILCDIAACRQKLHSPQGITRAHVIYIKGHVLACLQDLDTWWNDWLQNNREPCLEVSTKPENTFTHDENGMVFSTLLQYNELGTAYSLCTYNATRILLLQLLQRISQVESQALYPTSYEKPAEMNVHAELHNQNIPLLGISSDIQGLAHEIFRSIQYVQLQTNHFMTSFANFYHLDIAYSALDPLSREAKWFLSKISLPMRPSSEKIPAVHDISILHSCEPLPIILPSCRFGRK